MSSLSNFMAATSSSVGFLYVRRASIVLAVIVLIWAISSLRVGVVLKERTARRMLQASRAYSWRGSNPGSGTGTGAAGAGGTGSAGCAEGGGGR
jgi:hypothetical protein